ncbi:MAG: hypothetical protein QNK23_01940 [Crocinitomicaceae bacterium]|nr:hypothetical protein [Crocinitomicaceae bacterium]
MKGLLLFVGVLIFSYLFVITLEYFGRFNSLVRGVLLFSFIGVNVFILWKYIVTPTLKLKSFGNRIDRYQASSIIGTFFPNISDRLLNTLQLNDQMDLNSADFELLNASVQQRSSSMAVVPFVEAIDIGENRKHLTWVIPIILILSIIGVLSPSFLTQGTERVVNFTETYVEEAPFSFSLLTESGSIEEGEDFLFELELEGASLPEKVFIKSDQGRFMLTAVSKNKFQGKLSQVREDTEFHFEANGFNSDTYNIGVIAKTSIGKLQATLIYPAYLGKEKEVVENAGDLTIEEGTEVIWSVQTKNSDGVQFWLNDAKQVFTKDGFSINKTFSSNADGRIVLKNKVSGKRDTTEFVVEVIKDRFPVIQVAEVKDSIKDGIRYFSGRVGDDYGVSGLTFVYEITNKDGESTKKKIAASPVYGTESPFNFAVDFRREDIQLEDEIEYYFVVSDNDGVNGSKTTRSRSFHYELPTLEELNEEREEDQEKTKDDLAEVLKKAEEFRENLDRLRKQTLNSQESSWNKQQQVQQLQEEHESLLEQLQSVQEEMNNSVEEKNQLSEIDQELLDQQELINELLEELMDDEMKDLLDQLEKLMQEQDPNALEENMEQLEMSAEEMKDQLDRSLEMLKKTQVNERLDDIEEELKALAEEQEELREETQNEDDITDEQKQRQEEINEAFEEIKEDMEEVDSLNNELKRPMELGLDENMLKSEEVDEDLEESKDKLEKNKGTKASEPQKSAAQKMKEMAESMDAAQAEANKQQQQEDIDTLREILESLVALSFDQEEVMNDFKRIAKNDPAFRVYGRTQRKIVDNTAIVRDSLKALAERQPKIAKFIDKELNDLKVNHRLILEDIDERDLEKMLAAHQQFVMTSYNNLALMLNESLQQMQEQMKNMMPGSGSCNKPGGNGSPKPGDSDNPSDMKDMLKKQLEQMKKGQNPGGSSPGAQPGTKPGEGAPGGLGMGNKEIARMAAQQAAMRRRLEQMRNEMNLDGSGDGNRLNPLIDELEEQERALINKNLDNNLIERQQRILTRLLESENALMERGLDQKRESIEGKNEDLGNQIRFEEYNKEKLKQIELLRSVDPAYKKYYKDRANEYFNTEL